MVFLLASILFASRGITPTDGPAFPLRMLKGLDLVTVDVVPVWTNGVYNVNFIYQSPSTVSELTKQYRAQIKEAPALAKGADSYSYVRFLGSASQVVWITRNDGVPRKTTKIWVTEFASEASPPPTHWYRKAISSKPPIDLISVPFEPMVLAQSASIHSLRELVTTRPVSGRDAAEFSAHIETPFADEKKKAVAWFHANGYRDRRHGSWFKPNVPIFEMTIGPDIINRKVIGSHVQMYFSTKPNDLPVLFGPHA